MKQQCRNNDGFQFLGCECRLHCIDVGSRFPLGPSLSAMSLLFSLISLSSRLFCSFHSRPRRSSLLSDASSLASRPRRSCSLPLLPFLIVRFRSRLSPIFSHFPHAPSSLIKSFQLSISYRFPPHSSPTLSPHHSSLITLLFSRPPFHHPSAGPAPLLSRLFSQHSSLVVYLKKYIRII